MISGEWLKFNPGSSAVLAAIVVIDTNNFYFGYNDTSGYRLYHRYDARNVLIAQSSAYYIQSVTIADSLVYATTSEELLVIRNDRIIRKWALQSRNSTDRFIQTAEGLWYKGANLYKIEHGVITDTIPGPARRGIDHAVLTGRHSYLATYNAGYNLYTVNQNGLQKLNCGTANDFTVNPTTGLYLDNTGDIWISSIKELYHLRQLPYQQLPEANSYLHYRFQLNTNEEQVLCYDTLFTRIPNIRSVISALQDKADVVIMKVFEDTDTAWFCGSFGMLWCNKKGPLTIHRYNTQGNYVSDMQIDGDTKWFIGAASAIQYKKGVFQELTTGVNDSRIYSAIPDRAHRLWVARHSGLIIIDPKYGEIKGQLSDQQFRILLKDSEGNIWASGTKHHIYQIGLNGKNNISIRDSLASPFAGNQRTPKGLTFDASGNLWVSYTDGMVIFLRKNGNLSDQRYIYLSPEDGFAPFATSMQLCQTIEGNIASLEILPATIFHVRNILNRQQGKAPVPGLWSILINNKPFDQIGDFELDKNGLPLNLKLSYQNRNITFLLSSIGFHNAPYYRYQYRLLGLQDSWQETGTEDLRAVYTTLPAGAYTFMLRVANENGIWGKPFAYTFTILPPWYKTWWALGLWGMLLTGGMALAFYLRQRSIVKKYQVEQLITEQKLIALRAQINPHFIHNIFNFLSRKILHETREVAVGIMAKVSVYLRKILYLSEQHVISLEDEIGFIEEYLKIQQMIFNNKLTYVIDIKDDVNTFGVKVPAMLLQPIVENAVKYGTYGENDCIIHISITDDSDYITCSVSDNGITGASAGKPQEHISVGLELTKSKLAMMYARSKNKPGVTLSPNEHAGYTAVIKIPLS